MSLQAASFNNSLNDDPLLKMKDYQPNFILLGDKKNLFGDIIPVYKSYQELSDIIVSSQESLSRMIFLSKIFFICLFSFVFESINNVAYQSLLFVSSIRNEISRLPDHYAHIKLSFVELANTLTNHDTRDLWWLDFKLEVKQALQTIKIFVDSFFTVISKFYLSAVVLSILWVISSSSFINNSPSQNSLLRKALENHTTASAITPIQQNSTPILSILRQESDSKDLLLNNQVITHTVQPDESVEIIAEMYGLSPETIVFNNQLDESKPLPEKLYLPWSEGYLYKTKVDTEIEDLERIYGIDQNLIYSVNEDLLDRDKGKFPANTFILLPSTNYTDIATANTKEQARKDNLEQSIRQKNSVKRAATANNTTKRTFAGTFSDNKNSGFIWPTQGSISRCVTGAHIACDIANSSLPPVYSVQKGTVTRVGFERGGYGNVVIVDHGNGLSTLYAHLSEVYVKTGQQLIQGESIGRVGTTGRSTGPHLHFEVRLNGVKQNPLTYLP